MNAAVRIAALTVAGSDPTGGAGLQADLKTFAAHGVVGTAAVTALTVQGRAGVEDVQGVAASFVGAQVDRALEEARPAAAKTGMLWDGDVIRAVADRFRRVRLPLVVDPVLAATAGGDLLRPEALGALRDVLAPLAAILTPNLPEAARLLGVPGVADSDAEDAARSLLRLGSAAVLLKGGHGEGATSMDVLATREGVRRFSLPRVRGVRQHGTGCTLSASLAANLARGMPLAVAVERSKAYVHRALVAAAAIGPDATLVHDVPA